MQNIYLIYINNNDIFCIYKILHGSTKYIYSQNVLRFSLRGLRNIIYICAKFFFSYNGYHLDFDLFIRYSQGAKFIVGYSIYELHSLRVSNKKI